MRTTTIGQDVVDLCKKGLCEEDAVFLSPTPTGHTISPFRHPATLHLSPFRLGHLPVSPVPRGRKPPRSLVPSPAKCLAEDLKLTRLLGSGGFGAVYLAKLGRHTVAVKRMHSCSKNSKARVESFQAELRTLNLCHQNLVRMIASTSMDNPDDALIVMEYAGERNLQHVIDDHNDRLDTARRLYFGLQLATALEYLHQNCVVHLDLKPANVMVTPDDCCKVGDFGCSQEIELDTGRVSPITRSYLTGTFAYRAPELLRGQPPSTKADIYSLGITLWQMMTRERPYGKENQHVVIFAVVAYNLRPKILPANDDSVDEADQLYQQLLCECWANKQDDRPTAGQTAETFQTWIEYF